MCVSKSTATPLKHDNTFPNQDVIFTAEHLHHLPFFFFFTNKVGEDETITAMRVSEPGTIINIKLPHLYPRNSFSFTPLFLISQGPFTKVRCCKISPFQKETLPNALQTAAHLLIIIDSLYLK